MCARSRSPSVQKFSRMSLLETGNRVSLNLPPFRNHKKRQRALPLFPKSAGLRILANFIGFLLPTAPSWSKSRRFNPSLTRPSSVRLQHRFRGGCALNPGQFDILGVFLNLRNGGRAVCFHFQFSKRDKFRLTQIFPRSSDLPD